jgi:hypothetical protein
MRCTGFIVNTAPDPVPRILPRKEVSRSEDIWTKSSSYTGSGYMDCISIYDIANIIANEAKHIK